MLSNIIIINLTTHLSQDHVNSQNEKFTKCPDLTISRWWSEKQDPNLPPIPWSDQLITHQEHVGYTHGIVTHYAVLLTSNE